MTIEPNESVQAEDRSHLSQQADTLLELLRQRPVSSGEMLGLGVLQYNARISDIRKHLAGEGLTVAIVKTEGRLHWYQVRTIAEAGDPRRGPRRPQQRREVQLQEVRVGRRVKQGYLF